MVSKTTRVACVQTFPASSKTGVSSVRVADLLMVRFCFLEWNIVQGIFSLLYYLCQLETVPVYNTNIKKKKKKKRNSSQPVVTVFDYVHD